METIPVSGAEELAKHLQELTKNPELPLNTKLFDDVELQLNGKPDIPYASLKIFSYCFRVLVIRYSKISVIHDI